jgi:hypothetical protein
MQQNIRIIKEAARRTAAENFFNRIQNTDFLQRLYMYKGRLAFMGITRIPLAKASSRSLCTIAAEKSDWYEIRSFVDSPGSRENPLQA